MSDDGTSRGGIRAGVRRLFRLPLGAAHLTRADADAELDAFLAEPQSLLPARGGPAEGVAHLAQRATEPAQRLRACLVRGHASQHEVLDALRDERVELRVGVGARDVGGAQREPEQSAHAGADAAPDDGIAPHDSAFRAVRIAVSASM